MFNQSIQKSVSCQVTDYRAYNDPRGVTRSVEWEDYVKERTESGHLRFHDKSQAPLYGIYSLRPGASRCNEGVESIWGLTLDLDSGTTEQIEGTIAALLEEGIGFLAYTTFSHSEEHPKWRIDIPLDLPVDPRSWLPIWTALSRKYAPYTDPLCKDVSRQYYVPSCPEGGAPEMFASPGAPLATTSIAGPMVSVPLQKMSAERARTLAKIWRKRTSMVSSLRGERLEKMLNGEPFAEEGERDSVTWDLAGAVARAVPDVDGKAFAELARVSLEKMGTPTVAEFARKIDRARHGKPANDVDDAINQRRIVQHAGFLYFRKPGTETYGDAVHPKDQGLVLRDELGIAAATEEGTRDALLTHADRAESVEASYLARESTFSGGVLTVAPLRWAPLMPVFHQGIDRWLRTLFGADYSLAAQWIASVPVLSAATPAMILIGERGVGKTLLFQGLARIWGCAAVSGEQAVSHFNAGLRRNPLIFCDEAFPPDLSGARFREMITAATQKLEEKYQPTYDCAGYIRFAISANNRSVLRFQKAGVLTPSDIEAIGERILVIDTLGRGDEIRQTIPRARDEREAWARQAIAEHALHIAATVPTNSEARFLATPNGAPYLWDSFLRERHDEVLELVAGAVTGEAQRKWVGDDLWIYLDEEASRLGHKVSSMFEVIGAPKIRKRDGGAEENRRRWWILNEEARRRLGFMGVCCPVRP